jgi:hypothetical protein
MLKFISPTFSNLLATITLILFPAPLLATEDKKPIFECNLADAVTVEEGAFEKEGYAKKLPELYNPIIIDTATGAARFGTSNAVRKWHVVQQGSTHNHWVVSSHHESLRQGVTDFLRIVAPNELNNHKNYTIMFVGMTTIGVGTCQIIR